MNKISGKPQALKQVNLSAVRRAIRENTSATRAEIVEATQISVTTVRTLLTEMMSNGEIMEVGYDESIGGRRAVRYELKKDRISAVALCLDSENIRYAILNYYGECLESGSLQTQGNQEGAVCAFLDDLGTRAEIKSIGLGVPGIVNGLSYERKNTLGELECFSLGETLYERYGIPVIMENDLNAITLGFGRCYLKEFPGEKCENLHMAYIHFAKDCISAGFLANGRILRGWKNFVGELGCFPSERFGTLDDLLASPLPQGEYARIVAKMIAGICCILNPQFIALGGEGFRTECLPYIVECCSGTLPAEMSAEIIFAEDKWHDYMEGMAYLTSEQIFENMRLVTVPY